jgi:hypothetical protein
MSLSSSKNPYNQYFSRKNPRKGFRASKLEIKMSSDLHTPYQYLDHGWQEIGFLGFGFLGFWVFA